MVHKMVRFESVLCFSRQSSARRPSTIPGERLLGSSHQDPPGDLAAGIANLV
jgi:hypothetical protein